MDTPKNRFRPRKELEDMGYMIVEELGEGCYGIVLKVKKLEQLYAVKVIEKKMFINRPAIKKLCESERNILQQISNPNVIKCHQSTDSVDYMYLFLEYANDGDMGSFIKDQKNKNKFGIPEDTAIDYFSQILNGFKSLHELNVVHRDIKLDNILRQKKPNGEIILKIADLGFAKQLDQSNITHTQLGTPITKAPEILEKKSYGLECDLYSCGVIFYQMLFGIYPFIANNEQILLEKIKNQNLDFQKNGVQVSKEVEDLITQMLKYDRKDRIKWEELYSHDFFIKNFGEIFKSFVFNPQQSSNHLNNLKSFYKRQDLFQEYFLEKDYFLVGYPKQIITAVHKITQLQYNITEFTTIYFQNNPKFLEERFENMLEILPKINHPNIRGLQGVQREQGKIYYVQSYCNGGPLDIIIKNRNVINENNTVLILFQLIQALSQFHKQDLLHNNICPNNIHFHNMIVQLDGFELMTKQPVQPETSYKNQLYLAPEQRSYQTSCYNLSSEIYSIGLILYEMLHFNLPFSLNYNNQNTDRILTLQKQEDLKFDDKIVSKSMQNLLSRMLKFKNEKRIKFNEILQHTIFEQYNLNIPLLETLTIYRQLEGAVPNIVEQLCNINLHLRLKEHEYPSINFQADTNQIKQNRDYAPFYAYKTAELQPSIHKYADKSDSYCNRVAYQDFIQKKIGSIKESIRKEEVQQNKVIGEPLDIKLYKSVLLQIDNFLAHQEDKNAQNKVLYIKSKLIELKELLDKEIQFEKKKQISEFLNNDLKDLQESNILFNKYNSKLQENKNINN